MKKVWQGAVLLLSSLALCAVLGELTVRALYPRIKDYNMEMWRYASKIKTRGSNPRLPFTHAANRSGFFYGAEIRTNAFGFRDGDYPVQRVPGRERVMLIGDSFTLGWGVQFDSTYAKRLEDLLNQNGRPAEVINQGVGNYNTVMELELFREKGLQFQPDVVVLMYFINDAEPTPHVVGALKAAILTRSYLLAFLSDRYIRLMPLFNRAYDWKTYYSDLYQSGAPGYQASRQALIDLSDVCREHGIKLVVVNIPELRELRNYPFTQQTELVRSVVESRHVPFVDLLPDLVNQDPATLWVSRQDPHANSKANGIIANALYHVVTQIDSAGPAAGEHLGAH